MSACSLETRTNIGIFIVPRLKVSVVPVFLLLIFISRSISTILLELLVLIFCPEMITVHTDCTEVQSSNATEKMGVIMAV